MFSDDSLSAKMVDTINLDPQTIGIFSSIIQASTSDLNPQGATKQPST